MSSTTFDSSKEDSKLNQYWYSPKTIQTMVSEIEHHATKCAFLSTPSLYFNLTNADLKQNSRVFEFDQQWESDPGFVFYDFNDPEKVPVQYWNHFDYVVVDPPFITKEVWAKYAATVKLILSKEGGKVLFTSVCENHGVLEEVMSSAQHEDVADDHNDVNAKRFNLYVCFFRPSIPHLTYQYHCFTSYEATKLNVENPELPPEDPKLRAAIEMGNAMKESATAFVSQWEKRDRTNEVALPAPKKKTETATGEGQRMEDDPAMKWKTVPAGLTEYAHGASAPAPQETLHLPPEYHVLEAHRDKLDAYKKEIDSLTRILDVLIRQGAVISSHTASVGKIAEAKKSKDEAQKQMNLALGNMQGIVTELEAEGEKKGGSAEPTALLFQMKECIQVFHSSPPTTKAELMEFSADCTRNYKSQVFNRQKDLLAQMKKIKAEAAKQVEK